MVPIIGYLILFNAKIVEWLNLAAELGNTSVGSVSYRLILIYLGLCFVSLGVTIYSWLCPNEVKHYGSSAAYVQGDGPSLRGFVLNDIQLTVIESGKYTTRLEDISKQMEEKKYKVGLDDGDLERYRIENLHLHFDYLNHTYPAARMMVGWSYIFGFGLLGLPSGEVFVKVLGLAATLVGL